MVSPWNSVLRPTARKPANDSIPERIEAALELAFRSCAMSPDAPPRLVKAQRYALFPGGGRLRPQLCLLAATACGDRRPEVAEAAAAAVELLHCASLVHDDLPCFDDADTRRGKPSVHRVFGEPLALLVGDAFIVHAFDVLARASAAAPLELIDLIPTLAAAAGAARGILAGQAWESETAAPLDEYHRAKTASLFEAAAALGAIAAGAPREPWCRFGETLGRAYQAADDLHDALGDSVKMGKPTGRDARHGRPNIVATVGEDAARARLASWLHAAYQAIPSCDDASVVHAWVEQFAARVESL